MYYVFDNLELVFGPFETYQEAKATLRLHQEELYTEDYYPNMYIDSFKDEELHPLEALPDERRKTENVHLMTQGKLLKLEKESLNILLNIKS